MVLIRICKNLTHLPHALTLSDLYKLRRACRAVNPSVVIFIEIRLKRLLPPCCIPSGTAVELFECLPPLMCGEFDALKQCIAHHDSKSAHIARDSGIGARSVQARLSHDLGGIGHIARIAQLFPLIQQTRVSCANYLAKPLDDV